jgi:hypothetical protein
MLNFCRAKFIIGMLCFLGFSGTLWGKTIQISWNANPETDLSGYNIYCGTSSRNYSYVLNVGNTTSISLNGFLEGTTYYLAIKAYDYSGVESGFSDEVSVVIPAASSGEGAISRIISWITSLFGVGHPGGSQLANYRLKDFSTVSTQSANQALCIVRVGGASSNNPTSIPPAGTAEYIMKDAFALVGEHFDLASIYPEGTYLLLPIMDNEPRIENDIFSPTAPGSYLYLVADSEGEYLHILRISVLDIIYAQNDYVYGSQLYLQDHNLSISVALPPMAIEGEGNVPIIIGQNYKDIAEANAKSKALRGRHVIEFSIAPYGLVLSESAEIRVTFDKSSAEAEYYDQSVQAWKSITDARMENGQIIFSAQALGKFRVYDTSEVIAGESDGGGGGGGGCFISFCREGL